MTRPGIFRRTRTVAARDVDALGHVNNAVWVHLVVSLATAHTDALGYGLEATRSLGGLWIVRRHEIDYYRSARQGQTIVEETWVSSMRGARSVRCARFTDEDGAVLLGARTDWAFVDESLSRPRRIPEAILRGFPLVDEPIVPPTRPAP